ACRVVLILTIRNMRTCRHRQPQPDLLRLHRNSEDLSLAARVFDVIVVGTGAGGSTAMKILCEAGLGVCALNSGPRTDPERDYRQHRQVYDLKFRGYGDPLRLKGKAHQEPYSVEESEYSEGRDL